MFNKFKPNKVQTDVQPQETLAEVESQPTEVGAKLPSKIINSTQKPSIISEGASFEGNLTFDGALHLDGKFKGNIKVDKITVGKNGALEGKFEANTIIAFGEIKGEVTCGELVLNGGSSVEGQVQYANLKIHSGASISGQIHRKKI
ncbi:MAG: polymer-forming cytoskeletal protein [Methylotenera sp.]